MDICQIGYDICEFDSLRGLGIDVIGRVHFDNRDRFAIRMGSIGDRTMSTNEWLLTSDFWQFLEPWHGRWYEYEIFIASCTDNIYDLENERWLLGDMIDHVGIYGSRVAEGLSAFNVGLVVFSAAAIIFNTLICQRMLFMKTICSWTYQRKKFNFDHLHKVKDGKYMMIWREWIVVEFFYISRFVTHSRYYSQALTIKIANTWWCGRNGIDIQKYFPSQFITYFIYIILKYVLMPTEV